MENQTSPAPIPEEQSTPGADRDTRVLQMVRVFEASREAVYEAWTDPLQIIQWWGPEGISVVEHAFDPRPGGRWRTVKRGPDGSEHIVGGVYHELSPPQRLVTSWAWEGDGVSGHETLLTIDLKELGEHRCELHLTQELFESALSCGQHEKGWNSSFRCLTHHLERE